VSAEKGGKRKRSAKKTRGQALVMGGKKKAKKLDCQKKQGEMLKTKTLPKKKVRAEGPCGSGDICTGGGKSGQKATATANGRHSNNPKKFKDRRERGQKGGPRQYGEQPRRGRGKKKILLGAKGGRNNQDENGNHPKWGSNEWEGEKKTRGDDKAAGPAEKFCALMGGRGGGDMPCAQWRKGNTKKSVWVEKKNQQKGCAWPQSEIRKREVFTGLERGGGVGMFGEKNKKMVP